MLNHLKMTYVLSPTVKKSVTIYGLVYLMLFIMTFLMHDQSFLRFLTSTFAFIVIAILLSTDYIYYYDAMKNKTSAFSESLPKSYHDIFLGDYLNIAIGHIVGALIWIMTLTLWDGVKIAYPMIGVIGLSLLANVIIRYLITKEGKIFRTMEWLISGIILAVVLAYYFPMRNYYLAKEGQIFNIQGEKGNTLKNYYLTHPQVSEWFMFKDLPVIVAVVSIALSVVLIYQMSRMKQYDIMRRK